MGNKLVMYMFTISVQVKYRMLAAGQAFLPESLVHSLPALLAISLAPKCPDSYSAPVHHCPLHSCPNCSYRNGVEVFDTPSCPIVTRALLCFIGFIVGVVTILVFQKLRSFTNSRTASAETSVAQTAAAIALRRRHIQLA